MKLLAMKLLAMKLLAMKLLAKMLAKPLVGCMISSEKSPTFPDHALDENRQGGGEFARVALDPKGLHPRRRSGFEPDGGGRATDGLGQQAADRLGGGAVLGHGSNAKLQHRPSIRKRLDPVDRIAPASWRDPDPNLHPVFALVPGRIGHQITAG
jgi:hypothetical protein